jgi:hypothetical protein
VKQGAVTGTPATPRSAVTAPPPASVPPLPPPAAAARPLGRRVLEALGSMKLAVWLLLILAALTWLGTLAQVGRSIHDVQREYFESWFVIATLPLEWWGGKPLFGLDEPFLLRIPLPGAYPVLALLSANLLVGGMLRLRWNRRNVGVLIVHVGIVMLLVAGFVKLHYSYSGNMMLYETPASPEQRLEGRSYQASRFSSFHDFELALLTDKGDRIEERVVPEQQLWAARDRGHVVLRAPELPFTVRVHHWIDHSRAVPKGPMLQAENPVVDGAFLRQDRWEKGAEAKSEHEYAGCYVSVQPEPETPGAAPPPVIDGILWGFPRQPFDENRYPFTFEVRGQRYGLDLRHVTHDLPFAVRLDKFVKLDHPGTRSPREFRSFVTVTDGEQQQQAQIFMNNPLRRDGYVAYQSGWGPQPMGGPPWYTGLEVSYNPSDVWPTIACFVIAFGLLLHFLAKLWRFLHSSTRASLAGAEVAR